MAISARAALLREKRKEAALLGRFAGPRRVLSPYGSLSGQTSTIAKRALSAEIEAKERLYKDGQISNEEMRDFYQKLLANPLLTPLEKVEVQDNLRDFNDRIRLSALEAVYRQSPDNSLQKIQSAQAIADYYKSKASTMVSSTPAYNSAIEQFGNWTNEVANLTNKAQKTARANLRALQEAKIANLPHNSSERAIAKAQSYMNLYNQAVADDDLTEANRFLVLAKEQETLAAELQTRETEAAQKEQLRNERTDITNTINSLANAYHDGKITADQFAGELINIEQRAVAIGDTSIQLVVNRWADKLARDVEKGVRRGTIAGLPVVLGRGGAGGTGGTETNWDKEDYDYSDNLRLALADFKAGNSTPQQYAEDVALAIQERAKQIANRIQTIEAIVETNPNQKVVYEGRKRRAADILDTLYKEWDSLEEQAGAINKGNFALLEVPPTEGAELGKGKSIVTYKLIDPTTFEAGTVVPDKEGVYHELYKARVYLSPEEAQKAKLTPMGINVYTDPQTGKTYNLQTDEAGRLYYSPPGKQFYRVYWAGSNKFTELEYKPKEFAKTREEIQEEAERAYEEAAKAKKKEKEVKVPEPTMLEKVFGPRISKQLEKPPIVVAAQKAKETVAPIAEKMGEVIKPIKPVVEKVITAPLPGAPSFKPEEQVKITEPIRIAQPSAQPLIATPTTTHKEAEAARKEAEKLKIATPPTTPLQQAGFQIKLGPEFAPPVPKKEEKKPWWQQAPIGWLASKILPRR